MKLISLILLAAVISLSLCEVSIEAFEGPPFSVKPPSGMYQLSGLNFDNVTNGNQIAAYGDFNNDKYTDIVSLSDDRRTLTVYVYSHGSFSFWPFTHITLPSPIDAVIPADFDYDGNLDLLLVNVNQDVMQVDTFYFFRKQEAPFFGRSQNTPDGTDSLNTKVQPFLFDARGDRHMSLMFVENGVRTIQNLEPGSNFLAKQNFMDNFAAPEGSGCLNPSVVASNIFATPHSNSFVDFNGDCAADLFITSLDTNGQTVFETWLRNTDGRFCLVDASPITSKISQVTIGDMNNDGRMDLVFATTPSSGSQTSYLHIVYNQFPADYKNPCIAPTAEMKSPFAAGAYTAIATINGVTQVTPISLPASQNVKLYTTTSSSATQRIRLGDINIDGYPDVLMVVTPSSSTAKSGNILLGINEGGQIKFDNSTLSAPDDHAYFSVLLENKLISPLSKPLSEYQVLSASFFDFDEIGNLGIWAVVSDQSGKTKLVGLFNFVNSENFILKTLGLNGCPPTDDITQSLGGIYYGPSFECVLTDINGNPRLAKSVQLPQSAYTPLDLPYMFLGLGRTNNYVENFVMGIPKTTSANEYQIKEWTPIIPNSQLIVNPLIEKEWTLDVFVNPTSETLFIVLITLAILLILGIVIIYLHKKEKEEDEKNRDRILIG